MEAQHLDSLTVTGGKPSMGWPWGAVKYPPDGDRDPLRGGVAAMQQSKRDHRLREILKRKVDFKVHMGPFFLFTSWKVGRMGALVQSVL